MGALEAKGRRHSQTGSRGELINGNPNPTAHRAAKELPLHHIYHTSYFIFQVQLLPYSVSSSVSKFPPSLCVRVFSLIKNGLESCFLFNIYMYPVSPSSYLKTTSICHFKIKLANRCGQSRCHFFFLEQLNN